MSVRGGLLGIVISIGVAACGDSADLPVLAGTGPDPALPAPEHSLIPTVNIAPATGWPEGEKPVSAPGTQVSAFASGLDHPRWIYVLPNGDVLVAETNAPARPDNARGLKGWAMKKAMTRAGAGVPSADRISLLRDTDGDGVADLHAVLLDHLHSPFGMTLIDDKFYVADTDGILRFPYREGQLRISASGTKVTDLPGGPINHHWTKNLIASPDGGKLYVAIGSNSNVGENGMDVEEERAAIWEVDPNSGEHQVFASGLRNPVGMAFEPESGTLWTVVNERDELGSDLVPDYLTAVHKGDFFGWPYSYFGQHVDRRAAPQRPDLVAQAVVPDYGLGPHTASLGLANSLGNTLPARFNHGMFVGQHGSWNRKPRSGYKVIFVPFVNGKPAGEPTDILTGFVDAEGHARGRPVGVAIDSQGALLVADDVGNSIWRVTTATQPAQ